MAIFVKQDFIKINMNSIELKIREVRENKGEPLRKLAAYLDVDQAMMNKIEIGHRKAIKKQIEKLANFF